MAIQIKLRIGPEKPAPAPQIRTLDRGTRAYPLGPLGVPGSNSQVPRQTVAAGETVGQRLPNAQVDQALVARVQAGDKEAFNVLVQKYQHKLFKLISRYVRDQTEALDVAQEAFIKAYRALPNFHGDSSFYTWLYRIGVNTAKNHLVALGRRLPDSDIDVQDAQRYDIDSRLKDHDSPEAIVLRDEIERTVFSAMEKLPEDLRTAIILRDLKGLTYEEVAKVMACPIGTVRSRIYRAREAVHERLRPLLG